MKSLLKIRIYLIDWMMKGTEYEIADAISKPLISGPLQRKKNKSKFVIVFL
jgi:hypothetical protein